MVFVNTKKFACVSCIKGHRSSSCHHADRPLFEIKKKGRPVSQCEKCRELRHSRKVHSKCECKHSNDKDQMRVQVSSPSNKSRRFVPIVPALPNGLKDVLRTSQSSSQIPADSRQRVDTLLNPCHCKSVWKCQCRTYNVSDTPATLEVEPLEEVGLTVPTRAAVSCCHPQHSTTQGPLSSAASAPEPVQTTEHVQSAKPPISRPGNSTHTSHNHNKCPLPEPLSIQPRPAPDLPPILSSPSIQQITLPNFPTIPPVSTIKSLVGPGCTCGFRCGCPGCVQHRNPDKASKHPKECANECRSCIDYDGGIELPNLVGGLSGSTSIIDQFFARAAALPRPPINRKMGVQLDPMDVNVYLTAAREAKGQGSTFRLVNLPKLECCNGRCGCLRGACGCGESCDGSCADHGNTERKLALVDASLVPTAGETCRSPSPVQ